jgi:putative ubiquitin-RnfH superfamily antitoxin RatB of RatAB toxin-antitoxin module
MDNRLPVEVVLATPERQVLLTVNVEEGASVADVVASSGIGSQFPGLAVADMAVGIWGKPVSRDSMVNAGDRVELYRPLEIDPREARRQRARVEKG